MKKIIIAIDGPSGSGKTTTAKKLAEKLDYIYIDTGAMYRAFTLEWINSKTELCDSSFQKIISNFKIELKPSKRGQITLLNEIDVSEQIRTPEVTKFVSPVSANEIVRKHLVYLQRELGKNKSCVMDGRDIGSVVFPNAELKIYLTASIGVRAKRRFLEYQQTGILDLSFDEVAEQIVERDKYDSLRVISPLRKSEDAIEIDTSDLTLEQQIQKIYELAMSNIYS